MQADGSARCGTGLALFVLFPSVVSAQEPRSIKSGTRVRVWMAVAEQPVTEKILGLDATTMTLVIEGAAPPAAVSAPSLRFRFRF